MSQRSPESVEAAWRYHNGTKHSYQSVRTNPHALDWSNRPLPFKVYPALDPLRLPKEVPQSGMAALEAIAEHARAGEPRVPSLNELALLLYFAAGITKQKTFPGGEIYMRAAACTGALYEVEVYLVCGDLPQFEAGVYQFAPAEFGLRKLRAGDFRAVLKDATGAHPAVADAPLTMVFTGTYWRNAWKYQARTYRHFGWDNGTIVANLLAMCTATQLPATLVMGFADDLVNRLLDLDTQREVAFALAPVGWTASAAIPAAPPIESLQLETLPLSRHEVDYPAMREMHAATSLANGEEARSWREQGTPSGGVEPRGTLTPLQTPPDDQVLRDAIERVILRRGSTRQFAREPIGFDQLSVMLDRCTRGFAADFHNPQGALLNHLYVLVNAVAGLPSGAYYYHRDRRSLELLKQGEFRRQAGYLGLEQNLPADAAVNVFFLADLAEIFANYGGRGYRAAQIEAGILGGKLYLAAYAQRLGASGLTFYDDDVINFFSPHAEKKSAIFLMCLGQSALRK